jgi:acylphosphatase
MPVKIKSMETAPNGTVSVKLSFPDSELDHFLRWYASGNGKRRRSPAASRKAVRTRRKNAAIK